MLSFDFKQQIISAWPRICSSFNQFPTDHFRVFSGLAHNFMKNLKGHGQGRWKGNYIHTRNSVFTSTLAFPVLRDGTRARLAHISIPKQSQQHQQLLKQSTSTSQLEKRQAAFKEQCIFLIGVKHQYSQY